MFCNQGGIKQNYVHLFSDYMGSITIKYIPFKDKLNNVILASFKSSAW